MLEAVTNIPTEAQVEPTVAESGVKRPLEDTEVELPSAAAGVVWKMQGRSSNPSPSLASSWGMEREVALDGAGRVEREVSLEVARRVEREVSLEGAGRVEREVSLEVAWKVDLHSCVDSSPLYLSKEGRQMVAIGSHSGQVLPPSHPIPVFKSRPFYTSMLVLGK